MIEPLARELDDLVLRQVPLSDQLINLPDIGQILPAMGYGEEQMTDLARTIDNSDAEVVIIGTPIDLRRIIEIRKETVRVTYDLQVIGKPDLTDALTSYLS